MPREGRPCGEARPALYWRHLRTWRWSLCWPAWYVLCSIDRFSPPSTFPITPIEGILIRRPRSPESTRDPYCPYR